MQFQDNDYILYMAQEANFQTRSMLIPAKKFLSIPERKQDYDILKNHSIKNYEFIIDGNKYVIENLLIEKMFPVKNDIGQIFQCEKTEYLSICGKLTHYADGVDEYLDKDDDIWYDGAIIHFSTGFNHIKNYNKYKSITEIGEKKINIIDRFLVLEMRDGTIELPLFDTEEEMFKSLYCK